MTPVNLLRPNRGAGALRPEDPERDRRRRGRRIIGAFRPRLSGDASAANRRAVDTLTRYRDPGDYDRWIRDALLESGEDAIPEVADFFEELDRRDSGLARTLFGRVKRGLADGPTHLKPSRGGASGGGGGSPVLVGDVVAGLDGLLERGGEPGPAGGAAAKAVPGLLAEDALSDRSWIDGQSTSRPPGPRFADLKRAAGMTARQTEDGHTELIGRDGRTRVLTLSSRFAERLNDDADKFADRLAFLEAWRSGRLKDAELDARARDLLTKNYGPSFVIGERVDHLDRSAYDAFKEAERQIAAGADRDAVTALLVPSLMPELDDPDVIRDLILDTLPVIGTLRSAKSAFENAGAAIDALRQGDWGEASKLGLFTLLDTAGAIPGWGALFKPLKKAARLAIRKRPKLRRHLAERKINRAMGQFNHKVHDVFIRDMIGNKAWKGLDSEKRKIINAAFNRLKGDLTEKDIRVAFERGGFKLVRNRNKGVKASARSVDKTGSPERVYDFRLDAKIETTWDGRAVPGKPGTTVGEVKAGKADLTKNQARIDRKAREEEVSLVGNKPTKEFDLVYLRAPLDAIPEDDLVDAVKEQFKKTMRQGHIDAADLDSLVRGMYGQQLKRDAERLTVGEFLGMTYRLNEELLRQGAGDR